MDTELKHNRYPLAVPRLLLLLAPLGLFLACHDVVSQEQSDATTLPAFRIVDDFDSYPRRVSWTASYTAPVGQQIGELSITAEIASGIVIYAVTQESGGPLPTKFTLVDATAVLTLGEFKPDVKPTATKWEVWSDLNVKEHSAHPRNWMRMIRSSLPSLVMACNSIAKTTLTSARWMRSQAIDQR